MVISHEYQYVFAELAHTASTAIHEELCQYYGGEAILRKHASYASFLQTASAAEKRYFAFAGIRDPLDVAVSVYFKLKSNHRGNFTDPAKLREYGGWVTPRMLKQYAYIRERNADFPTFFRMFYRIAHYDRRCLAHEQFDFVIRYEHLQADFAQVLELLGIEQQRPLPVVNRTAGKGADFHSYYSPEIRERAERVFGPYMRECGYRFPVEWGVDSVPAMSWVPFRVIAVLKRLYWFRVKEHPLYLAVRGWQRQPGLWS
jgi:hypothetical protein